MAQVNEGAPLIDERILDRQTMGDRQLALELLDMFVAQLDAVAQEIASCSFERRAALAHAVKGTARSLGIEEVATFAVDLEIADTSRDAVSRLPALAARLRHEVAARRRLSA